MGVDGTFSHFICSKQFSGSGHGTVWCVLAQFSQFSFLDFPWDHVRTETFSLFCRKEMQPFLEAVGWLVD